MKSHAEILAQLSEVERCAVADRARELLVKEMSRRDFVQTSGSARARLSRAATRQSETFRHERHDEKFED